MNQSYLVKALIHSDAARQGALEEHRSIKLSTYGIIFLGTPHQGGNGVQLGKLLVNIASVFVAADDHLLRHLERDSEWLQQQLGQYGPISRDFVTKFAFEEYETPTVLGHSILVRGLLSWLAVETAANMGRWCRVRLLLCLVRRTLSLSGSTQTIGTWSDMLQKKIADTTLYQNIFGSWQKLLLKRSSSIGTRKGGSRKVSGFKSHILGWLLLHNS